MRWRAGLDCAVGSPQLRTGQVFVNSSGMCVVQPFGGCKQSAVGREGGIEGRLSYNGAKVISGL